MHTKWATQLQRPTLYNFYQLSPRKNKACYRKQCGLAMQGTGIGSRRRPETEDARAGPGGIGRKTNTSQEACTRRNIIGFGNPTRRPADVLSHEFPLDLSAGSH